MAQMTVIHVPRDERLGELGQGIAQGAAAIATGILRRNEEEKKRKAAEAAARASAAMVEALRDKTREEANQMPVHERSPLAVTQAKLLKIQTDHGAKVTKGQRAKAVEIEDHGKAVSAFQQSQREAQRAQADGQPPPVVSAPDPGEAPLPFDPSSIQLTQQQNAFFTEAKTKNPKEVADNISLNQIRLQDQSIIELREAMADPDFARHKDFAAITKIITDTVPEFAVKGTDIKAWVNVVAIGDHGKRLGILSMPRNTSSFGMLNQAQKAFAGTKRFIIESPATTDNKETQKDMSFSAEAGWDAAMEEAEPRYRIKIRDDLMTTQWKSASQARSQAFIQAKIQISNQINKEVRELYDPQTPTDFEAELAGEFGEANQHGSLTDLGTSLKIINETRRRLIVNVGRGAETKHIYSDLSTQEATMLLNIRAYSGANATMGAFGLGMPIPELTNPTRGEDGLTNYELALQKNALMEHTKFFDTPYSPEAWEKRAKALPKFADWLLDKTIAVNGKKLTLRQMGRTPNHRQYITGMDRWNITNYENGTPHETVQPFDYLEISQADLDKTAATINGRFMAEEILKAFQSDSDILKLFEAGGNRATGAINEWSIESVGGKYVTWGWPLKVESITPEQDKIVGYQKRLQNALIKIAAGATQTKDEAARVMGTMPRFGKSPAQNLNAAQQTVDELRNLSPALAKELALEMSYQLNPARARREDHTDLKNSNVQKRLQVENLKLQSPAFLTNPTIREELNRRAAKNPRYLQEWGRLWRKLLDGETNLSGGQQ